MNLRWIAVLSLNAAALWVFAACGPTREPFVLRAVVQKEIDSLQSEIATIVASSAQPIVKDEIEKRASGWIESIETGDGDLGVLAEAHGSGDAATTYFERELHAKGAALERRKAILALLGATQSPTAALVIARELARAEDASLRTDAALTLAVSGQDFAVPALLEALFVETDAEATREICFALCLLGNESGVARLTAMQAYDKQARARLEVALARAKETNPSAQWDNLQGSAAEILSLVWSNGDPQRLVSTNVPSLRQRLEVWKRIALLASTNSGLAQGSNENSAKDGAAEGGAARGGSATKGSAKNRSASDSAAENGRVNGDPRERAAQAQIRFDSAEFVLEHGAPWTAELLASALHDEDRGVREGAARALGRMGWRARGAWTALVAALDEPSIAAESARALGWIGEPSATDALLKALAGDCVPVRAAAALSLGNLGEERASNALRRVLKTSEPIEVRIAATCALARLGHGDEVAPLMLDLFEAAVGDLAGIETELEARLVAAQHDERAGASAALKEWRALRAPPNVELDASAIADRYRARAQVLRELPLASR